MSLLRVTERLNDPAQAQATLTLPFELRQKSRLRTQLDSGEAIGLILPRGNILRSGDCLRAENGLVIQLIAAPEPVSTATTGDSHTLLRASYHLGNRHVPLQIAPGWLRYLQDHVLDDMLISLGLNISHESAPFEPEAGAYHHHHQSSNGNNHHHDDTDNGQHEHSNQHHHEPA